MNKKVSVILFFLSISLCAMEEQSRQKMGTVITNLQKSKKELPNGTSLSDVHDELILHCAVTNDLFTTIKNLLVLGKTCHRYRTLIMQPYCSDFVAEHCGGNPLSIAVALGHTEKSCHYERTRLEYFSKENIQRQEDQIRFYTDQNDISGLIALLKCGFNLWDYYFKKNDCHVHLLYQKEILEFLMEAYKKNVADIDASLKVSLLTRFISPTCSLSYIQFLIDNGAKVSSNGHFPLRRAASFGRKDILELLIKNEAHLNSVIVTKLLESLAYGYWWNCSKKNQKHTMQYDETLNYIAQFELDANARLASGETLLRHCVYYEYQEAIKLLLDRGADPLLEHKGENVFDMHFGFKMREFIENYYITLKENVKKLNT